MISCFLVLTIGLHFEVQAHLSKVSSFFDKSTLKRGAASYQQVRKGFRKRIFIICYKYNITIFRFYQAINQLKVLNVKGPGAYKSG